MRERDERERERGERERGDTHTHREREREREREITHLELSHVSTDGTGVPEGRSGAEPRRNASTNITI